MTTRRIVFAVALVAMITRIVFWAMTHRTWEDALITVLHSENFARGLGLTHVRVDQPRLHGFTSPLSVLVPLVGDLIRIGWGIELLRIVSVFAGALSVLYAASIALHRKVALPAGLVIACAGFIAIEHHQILWGMAGMETQLVTCILLGSIYYLLEERPLSVGVFLGLCMLARPDFAAWVGLALVSLVVFRWPLSRGAKEGAIALAALAAVYLPWIIATTLYYGTPLPHTVIAKSTGYSMWWSGRPITFELIKQSTPGTLFDALLGTLVPSFGGHGTGIRKLYPWGDAVVRIHAAFVFIGIARSAFAARRGTLPIALFALGYGAYYTFLVPVVFGWYVVPYAAVATLLWALGLNECLSLLGKWNPSARPIGAVAAAAGLLLPLAWAMPRNFDAEWRIQHFIEDRVRKQLAIDLGKEMGPHQTIASESLGYLAYYSGRSVYDWPGLCNREVPAWAKTQPRQDRNLIAMMRHFEPDYLLLRHGERGLFLSNPESRAWFEEHYELWKQYEADPKQVARIQQSQFNVDTLFYVMKKRGS